MESLLDGPNAFNSVGSRVRLTALAIKLGDVVNFFDCEKVREERRRRVIALAEKEQITPVLDRFMGIDTGRHVWFELGEITVPGSFEAAHSDEGKGELAAVHFVRFGFSPEAGRAFGTRRSTWWSTTPRPVRAPRLSQEARAELLTDLASRRARAPAPRRSTA
jgi:hypothetical protein